MSISPHDQLTPAAAHPISRVPRLVLDTNVCLDLFVFKDPRWATLLLGLQQGRLLAVTRSGCRDEWLTVLHYSHLPVNDDNRPECIAAFDGLIELVSPAARNTAILPRCTDPDDQQFMELARDSQADYLITKDKALLKCAKKIGSRGLFVILTPELFIKNIKF